MEETGLTSQPFPQPCEIAGMSLRDWFAGQALSAVYMQGIVSIYGEKDLYQQRAELVYKQADAMIADRQPKEK